ncbi:MAG: class I SAM-dependent methyltransferase [Alphaproteobacteria bacterium]
MDKDTENKINGQALWFGHQPVQGADRKQHLVNEVFSRVANRYDVMNDCMSLGTHRLWRREFITMLRPRHNPFLLDLAGGTGDIARRFLQEGGKKAWVCDINRDMLAKGRDMSLNKGYGDQLSYVVADSAALPFPDSSVDLCSMAFGLRNVARLLEALCEIRRVLKPGGRFFCLEFSCYQPQLGKKLYDLWLEKIVPQMGHMLLKDRESYQYLAESINRFPDQPALAKIFSEAGFARVQWQNLSGGVVAIHQGAKL